MTASAEPDPFVAPGHHSETETVDLDAVQQRLFAAALGVRGVRARIDDATLTAWLDRIEAEIDACIQAVRPGARGQRGPSDR
jgi:hypothetical protein